MFFNENSFQKQHKKHCFSWLIIVAVFFITSSVLSAQTDPVETYESQEADLKKAITLNNTSITPYLDLAFFYRSNLRSQEAKDLYLQILAIDGKSGEPYYGIGQLYFEEGKYKDATNLFTIAIEKYLARNSILVYDAFYYRGMCMYRLGNYAGALKNLQNAAKYYSDNGEILTLIDELTIKTSTKKSLND